MKAKERVALLATLLVAIRAPETEDLGAAKDAYNVAVGDLAFDCMKVLEQRRFGSTDTVHATAAFREASQKWDAVHHRLVTEGHDPLPPMIKGGLIMSFLKRLDMQSDGEGLDDFLVRQQLRFLRDRAIENGVYKDPEVADRFAMIEERLNAVRREQESKKYTKVVDEVKGFIAAVKEAAHLQRLERQKRLHQRQAPRLAGLLKWIKLAVRPLQLQVNQLPPEYLADVNGLILDGVIETFVQRAFEVKPETTAEAEVPKKNKKKFKKKPQGAKPNNQSRERFDRLAAEAEDTAALQRINEAQDTQANAA